MICVTFKKNFCSVANQNGGGRFFSSKIGQISTFAPSTYWVFFRIIIFFSQNFSSLFCVFKKSRQFACNLFSSHHANALSGVIYHHSFGDMSIFSGEVAAEVILTSSGTVVVVGTAAATAAFKGGGSILPFPV